MSQFIVNQVLDKKGQAVFDENGELKFELEEVVVSFFDAVTGKS